jgi:hypothetical protein
MEQGSPMAILRQHIAEDVDRFMVDWKGGPLILVWEPLIEAVDLQSQDFYVEASARLIERTDAPFNEHQDNPPVIVKRFLSTLRGAKIQGPPPLERV